MRIALTVALLLLAGCGTTPPRPPAVATPAPPPSPAARSSTTAAIEKTIEKPIEYPERGAGTWLVAAGQSRVAGRAGRLMRYRVAVERGIRNVDPAAFASAVDRTLADPRSWTGDGQWRLRRVGPGSAYDFTVYLATPATRDKLCATGYDRYTSCRNGASVVINVARWVHGVPHYGAELELYRQYVVNHEVGHRLGNGHEKCPERGRPAPVMQQQTLGLHGCVANAWPLVDGERYRGPSGAYDDPLPKR
ncbi:DUF3152 domain-containing protein [Micromonospora sp. CPCC 206061]|uniref:DUF3152 domain-containing protein n=1 Tax=Micromonospora sp. CPCC 206061 TaxID=3122410 RepID=UPI002FF15D1C